MTRRLAGHWSARESDQAARDAGRVGKGPSAEEPSEAEIRAEYEAVREADAYTARELERQFPWLRK